MAYHDEQCAARRPHFPETVVIVTASAEVPVPANVMDQGADAPMGRSNAEAGLMWYSVRMAIADCRANGITPHARDTVRFMDGTSVPVARVVRTGEHYELICRGRA